jgi:ADP-heptose:LPS heptosyltransferase
LKPFQGKSYLTSMKILCVQFRQLGDILMTTPSLRALKEGLPGCSITFLAERGPARAVANNPDADEILRVGDFSFLGLIRALRRRKFDVAIDFMGTPSSARTCFFSGAPVRVGFTKKGRSWFYSRRVPPQPDRAYSAASKAALLKPLGVSCASFETRFFPTDADRQEAQTLIRRFNMAAEKNVVALSPVSRREYKRWPLASFAAVCDALHRDHGLRFLPLFGPDEEEFIRDMVALSSGKEAFLFPCEPLSFGALKPVLEKCLFYLGNDNGIRHMAIASGLPTAAIFGLPDPLNWTPPGNLPHFHLWAKADLASVTVEAVVKMAEKALQAALTGLEGCAKR